jgi:rhodanese-related sulfurtransferase
MTCILCLRRLLAGWGWAFVLIGGLSVPLVAVSAESAPMEIRGAVKVSAEEVFSLFESTPGLVIVDSRLADGPSSGRAQGFIEGSVSLPDIRTDCTALARVIPKKDTPALFYCNGPKCGRSAKAIEVARGCGYRKMYWFRGGFEEWLEKGYPYVKG